MKNLITITSLVAAAAMTTTAFAAGNANTILVNFASGNGQNVFNVENDEVNGTWNNLTGNTSNNSSQNIVSSDGSAAGTIAWSSKESWGYTTEGTDTVLKGYLDDGNGITIDVTTNFLVADVTIYCSTDTNESKFSAKTVNRVSYTYKDGQTVEGTNSWGYSHAANGAASISEGRTALTISGVSGMNISISSIRDDGRGCIAGLKIVNAYKGTAVEISAAGTQIDWTDSALGSETWTNSTASAGKYAAFTLSVDTTVNVSGTNIVTDAITASGSGTLTLSGNAISVIGPGVVRTDSDSANIIINNILNFANGGTISGNVTFGENAQLNVNSGWLQTSMFPTASITLEKGATFKTTTKLGKGMHDFSKITGLGTIIFNAVTGNSGYDGGIKVNLSDSFTGDFVLNSNVWLSFASDHSTFGNATIVLSGNALFHSTKTVTFEKNIRFDGSAEIWTDNNNATVTLNGNVSGTGTLNRKGVGVMIFAGGLDIATFSQEVGATTVSANNAKIATLNISGGSINFSGASASAGTVNASGNTSTLTGTLSIGDANATEKANVLRSTGGTLNIENATLNLNGHSIAVRGAGTINQKSGTINAGSLRLHDEAGESGSSIYNLSGGVLNLSKTNEGNNTSSGVLIGHWGGNNGKGILNVSGGVLNAKDTDAVVSWTSSGEFSISGGEVNLRGINLQGQSQNSATVTLSGSGRLNIGKGGLSTGNVNAAGTNKVYNFNGGTLGALDNWSTESALKIGGNITIDTVKRTVSETGVSEAQTGDAAAATITLSGILSDGDAAGSLTKVGAGTLVLNGENTFTGGVAINAGTVQAGNASALGTGVVKIDGGQLNVAEVSLNVSALEIVLSDKYKSDGSVAAITGVSGSSIVDGTTVTLSKGELASLTIATEMTFKIADASISSSFTKDDFILDNSWGNWIVSNYDTNSGVITLSSAVPEPSMFGLQAGLGALALVGARRRRKTK